MTRDPDRDLSMKTMSGLVGDDEAARTSTKHSKPLTTVPLPGRTIVGLALHKCRERHETPRVLDLEFPRVPPQEQRHAKHRATGDPLGTPSVLDDMQARLEQNPDAMRIRRSTVEHPFGTIKAWMKATHFLTKGLDCMKTEMRLYVLAYNLRRSMAVFGIASMINAITRSIPFF